MAFDTLVDKTVLETAMTATADSIRGKTGETSSITWDASTGFAAAIAAITDVGVPVTLPDGYAMEMGIYVPDADKSSAVTIDLQNTFRWADTGKESACYILVVGVDIRKGTQAAALGAHVKFGVGERNHQMVTTTSGCSTSSTVFTNPISTTTFNKITITGTSSYPLKKDHSYLWMVIGELAS